MGNITIAEASVAARLGAVLAGGSYTIYGFSVLQTQLAAILNSSLVEAKLILGDPVDDSLLATCNEIAMNLACRDVAKMCLTGPLLTDGISFSLTGLNINKGQMPGAVEQLAAAFEKKVQDLLLRFQSLGGITSTTQGDWDQDTLGMLAEDEEEED
jgi:hypothetical protein